MKIVSIDVGIRNLSLCVFEVDDNILSNICHWEVVDLCDVPMQLKCCQPANNKKKGLGLTQCPFNAKYLKPGISGASGTECYCTKHAKMQPYILPNKALLRSQLNKRKLVELVELAKLHNLNVSGTRPVLINRLDDYRVNHCLEDIKTHTAVSQDLVTVAHGIIARLDVIFSDGYSDIDYVIIENQLDRKMHIVQGMLTQFFITRNTGVKVEFISPINKLKEWAHELGTDSEGALSYRDRKNTAITKSTEIISQHSRLKQWENHLLNHKKKDDLADAFLQGWWYVRNKPGPGVSGK